MEAIYELVQLIIKQEYDPATELDVQRTVLEPYIYHYLIEKYGPMLEAHWMFYIPPAKSDNVFVIVERRPHPNFKFIIQNIAWAAPHMAVYIFCSDENHAFINAVLGDKAPYFTIIEIFKGSVSPEEGKTQYNNLLTNYQFYESIPANYMITVQMDTIFRKKLPNSLFTGDYWGAPWAWQVEAAGGGGATIRRIAAMSALCRQFRPDISIPIDGVEDFWISSKLPESSYPDLEFRKNHILESVPAADPCILHQFWTFSKDHSKIITRDQFIWFYTMLLTFTL